MSAEQVTINRGNYADLSKGDAEKQEIVINDEAPKKDMVNDKSPVYILIITILSVLSLCFVTWAIVFTVLWYRAEHKSHSNSGVINVPASDLISKNIYYNVIDMKGSHDTTVCDVLKPQNCSEVYALYPLYDRSTNVQVGSVSFYDIKQIDHNGNSIVREIATFQFTNPDYIPYVYYKVDFLSKSELAYYPAGYVLNTVSYSNDIGYGNVNVTLTLSGNERFLNFIYKKQQETSISTTNNVTYIYYDKTDFQGLNNTTYCVKGYSKCTIQAYNARLFDTSNKHIGHAFFYDILQESHDGLFFVKERATYTFTDHHYNSFVYDYAYISTTDNSVFPPGFKLDVKMFASTHNNANIVEVLEVFDTKRYISLKGCIFESCSKFAQPFPPPSLKHSVNVTYAYDAALTFFRDCGSTLYTGKTNCSSLITSFPLFYQNKTIAGDINSRAFLQYRDGYTYDTIYYDVFLFYNQKKFSFYAFLNSSGHYNIVLYPDYYILEQKSFVSSDPAYPGYWQLKILPNSQRSMLLAF